METPKKLFAKRHPFEEAVLLSWGRPKAAFWIAFGAYFLIALPHYLPWQISDHSYFNYLADAFLHGQLYLRLQPSSVLDLIIYEDRLYLYWPPFPAILLMPLVAVFGVNFSDIFFTILVGSANVALISAVLEASEAAGMFQLGLRKRAIMVVFFALGTVQLTLAVLGGVWFTAQEVGLLCVLLTYLIAIKMRGWPAFLLAGLAMGAALATRNHLIFAGIWPAWYLLRKHWPLSVRRFIGLSFLGALPVFLSIGLLVSYNIARFGSPTDSGMYYQNVSTVFNQPYLDYGAFNVRNIPINFYYQYIAYPFPLRFNSLVDGETLQYDSLAGGSLFLLSPLFFAAFYGIWRYRRQWSTWMLVLTIVAVDIPILLLTGTGWVQFGPRYSLDFMVPLLLLTALAVQHMRARTALLLSLPGFIHYLVGVIVLSWMWEGF
jgi:hypothetical protein